jgi:hypothetical protein
MLSRVHRANVWARIGAARPPLRLQARAKGSIPEQCGAPTACPAELRSVIGAGDRPLPREALVALAGVRQLAGPHRPPEDRVRAQVLVLLLAVARHSFPYPHLPNRVRICHRTDDSAMILVGGTRHAGGARWESCPVDRVIETVLALALEGSHPPDLVALRALYQEDPAYYAQASRDALVRRIVDDRQARNRVEDA